jgi:tetratricopeptide (TPR) repeat protein/thiol-disulfide isomerase/thioredoxin
MLLLFLLGPAHAAALELLWTGGVARLVVHPPPDEHVNVDAPARISSDLAEVSGRGDLAWARLPVAAGTRVEARIPVCREDGSACREILGVALVGEARRGRVALLDVKASNEAPRAAGSAVRIYDFAAEWCPPCQQMAAEVLHDPDDAALLAPYTVEAVDADAAESWRLKSRYHVGGYPTLVAVDAAGDEVDRFLGYPDEAALHAWIRGLQGAVPLAGLLDGPPPGADADSAAATALRLARAGHSEAAWRWVVLARRDALPAVEARLLLDPALEDARLLVRQAPDGAWIVDAMREFPLEFPELLPRCAGLGPGSASSCLAAYADALPPEQADGALAARTGALALVWSEMTTDAAHNRGFIVDLTDLLAQTGNLPRAIGILDEYVALYPEEFTWDFAAARLLSEAGRLEEAAVRATAALAKADGDQQLRAVVRLGRILHGLGRDAEAITLLEHALSVNIPDPSLDVRTHRYRKEAEALRAEIAGASPVP